MSRISRPSYRRGLENEVLLHFINLIIKIKNYKPFNMIEWQNTSNRNFVRKASSNEILVSKIHLYIRILNLLITLSSL